LHAYAEILGWGIASNGGRGQRDQPTGRDDMLDPDASTRLLAMRRAHDSSAVDPADAQLIEGCGSGIGATDGAELAALAALRRGAAEAAALGSISANIGNAGAAAGAASVIKAVLAIASGVLPPSTGMRCPHPTLLDGTAGLRLLESPELWPDGVGHAAVGGADADGLAAHLVLGAGHARRMVASRSAGSYAPTPGHPFAYLLRACDRQAMTALLARIATIATWLSDAQMQDLAVHLSRQSEGTTGKAGQHYLRIALTAADQDQLATLATTAK